MQNLRLDGTEVCASWLTQRSHRAAYCDFLLPVTPENKEASLAEFAHEGELGKYRGLRVSGISDLSFLKKFPLLLYLEVLDQKKVNSRPLDGLSNLRGLRLEMPGAGLDFGCFPELEVFVGDWHPDNSNLNRCQELRQIRAWKFKPRSKDLSDLTGVTRLEQLAVTQSDLTSLAGVEALEDLRYLDVAYVPKLESLTALSKCGVGIRELDITNARNVRNYKPIASLQKLRNLRISYSAPMKNLKWTAGLNNLDSFSFVDTNVEDGDLSPLLKLPKLRYVGSMNKKHYSHNCDDLNEVLNQRDERSA